MVMYRYDAFPARIGRMRHHVRPYRGLLAPCYKIDKSPGRVRGTDMRPVHSESRRSSRPGHSESSRSRRRDHGHQGSDNLRRSARILMRNTSSGSGGGSTRVGVNVGNPVNPPAAPAVPSAVPPNLNPTRVVNPLGNPNTAGVVNPLGNPNTAGVGNPNTVNPNTAGVGNPNTVNPNRNPPVVPPVNPPVVPPNPGVSNPNPSPNISLSRNNVGSMGLMTHAFKTEDMASVEQINKLNADIEALVEQINKLNADIEAFKRDVKQIEDKRLACLVKYWNDATVMVNISRI